MAVITAMMTTYFFLFLCYAFNPPHAFVVFWEVCCWATCVSLGVWIINQGCASWCKLRNIQPKTIESESEPDPDPFPMDLGIELISEPWKISLLILLIHFFRSFVSPPIVQTISTVIIDAGIVFLTLFLTLWILVFLLLGVASLCSWAYLLLTPAPKQP